MMLSGTLRARLVQTAVVAAFAAWPLVSCTTDEIVAFEGAPDAGTLPQGNDAAVVTGLCGNGVLNDGEGCDDGNTTSGDGCSATCKVDGVPAAGTCPGAPIALTSPSATRRVGTVSGDTTSS